MASAPQSCLSHINVTSAIPVAAPDDKPGPVNYDRRLTSRFVAATGNPSRRVGRPCFGAADSGIEVAQIVARPIRAQTTDWETGRARRSVTAAQMWRSQRVALGPCKRLVEEFDPTVIVKDPRSKPPALRHERRDLLPAHASG
jgi:hypothetical protein